MMAACRLRFGDVDALAWENQRNSKCVLTEVSSQDVRAYANRF
jgi:hypothetical protein